MSHFRRCSALVLAVWLALPPAGQAQAGRPMLDRYARAEQLLPWNTGRIVFGDEVDPQWYKDGTRFWFRNKTKAGADFLTVDPVSSAVRPLFDNARLAAELAPGRAGAPA